jgi:hypothetical protein
MRDKRINRSRTSTEKELAMTPEILKALVEAGSPWVVFLLAVWLFRDHIDFRFRPPPGPRGRNGQNKP